MAIKDYSFPGIYPQNDLMRQKNLASRQVSILKRYMMGN